MKSRILHGAFAFLLTGSICSLANAGSLGQFDARSVALGGAGVAGAQSANAAAFNPALMAAETNKKSFSIIPFAIHLDLVDENDFVDTIEAADESINDDGGLNDRLDQVNEGTQVDCSTLAEPICYQQDSMAPAAQKTAEVLDHINSLNKSNALINANTGIAIQFGRSIPMALVIDGGVTTKLGLKFASSDTKELDLYANTMSDGRIVTSEYYALEDAELIDTSDPSKLQFIRGSDDSEEFKSLIEVLGATYYEFGLSFADSFDYAGGKLALGVTPKVVSIEAVKYHQSIEAEDLESDDILDDDNTVSKTDFNVDVGAVFKPFDTLPLQAGVSIKNLFTRTYDLKKSAQELEIEALAIGGDVDAQADLDNFNFRQNLKIEPQLTAGISYQLPLVNLLADIDLNAAEMLGQTNQHLALGAEFDARLLKLQLGYRTAIGGDDEEDAISGGVGLGPLGIAVITAGDHIGGVVQFSVSF